MGKSVALLLLVLLISNRSSAADLVLPFSWTAQGSIPPGAGPLVNFPPFDSSLGSLESIGVGGTITISATGFVGVSSTWPPGSATGSLTYSATSQVIVFVDGNGFPIFTSSTSSVPVSGELTLLTATPSGWETGFSWQPTLLTPTAPFGFEESADFFEGMRLIVTGQTNPATVGGGPFGDPGMQMQNANAVIVTLNGSIDYTYTPVPEPGALTLLGTASLSLALFRRRWRKH